MSALIGALRATLSADTANFEAGMKRAQRQAATSGSAITKSMGALKAGLVGLAAGLSIGLLSGAIKRALDYAGSLAETAQQLGVTTKQLQTYRFAAGQVGVSQEEMDKGLMKLNVNLGKAALGAAAPKAAFDQLSKLIGKDIVASAKQGGDALPMVADGLSKITDSSKRAAIEVIIFSRAGAKLDTLLAGGSAALNELAAAAEKLGIVLSDEQIQNADVTADKLAALMTVLKAQIAGAVANNTGAILGFVNRLIQLIAKLQEAAHYMDNFRARFNAAAYAAAGMDAEAARARGEAFKSGTVIRDGKKIKFVGGTGNASAAGRSVTVKLGAPGIQGPARLAAPTSFPQFLGGGGGSKKKAPKGPKDTSLRDAFQFDQDIRRARMDVLRATQDLATDYVERSAIAIQILDAEKAAFEAELIYKVAAEEMTGPQAEQLRLLNNKTDDLRRQKELADQETKRQEEYGRTEELRADIAMNLKQAQGQLAETAVERRQVELEILALAYEEKRRRLQRIIDESKDADEQHRAWLELNALGAQRKADTAGVMASTRGPWEQYANSIPNTAAKMTEALEQVRVDGVESLTGALMDTITGVKSLGDAFSEVAQQIMQDLLRIYLRKLLVGALGNALGGIGGIFGGSASGGTMGDIAAAGGVGDLGSIYGFARGGSFSVLGRGGTDRNLLSLNGLPIARVSHGERIDIANDNVNGGGGMNVVVSPSPYFDVRVQQISSSVATPLAGRAAVMGAAGAEHRSVYAAKRRIP